MRKLLGIILMAPAVLEVSTLLGACPQAAKTSSRSRGTLDVVVLDEENRRLPKAEVSLLNYRSTTGLAGTCMFEIPPGRYSVLVRMDGYRDRRVNAVVRRDEVTTTQVHLQKQPRTPSSRKSGNGSP